VHLFLLREPNIGFSESIQKVQRYQPDDAGISPDADINRFSRGRYHQSQIPGELSPQIIPSVIHKKSNAQTDDFE
jgi:hypothetical protein